MLCQQLTRGRIYWIAEFLCAYRGRLDIKFVLQSCFFHHVFHHKFSHWTSANIPMAKEKYLHHRYIAPRSFLFSIARPPNPCRGCISKGRFENEAPFSIIGILAGVPLPAFLLTQRVCSSTISTSKYLLFIC